MPLVEVVSKTVTNLCIETKQDNVIIDRLVKKGPETYIVQKRPLNITDMNTGDERCSLKFTLSANSCDVYNSFQAAI